MVELGVVVNPFTPSRSIFVSFRPAYTVSEYQTI